MCHVRYLHPMDKNPARITKSDKKHARELDYRGVQFPVKTKDYDKIERQNGIRVNVFGYERKQVFPIYVSSERYERELDLLLIALSRPQLYGVASSKGDQHYCQQVYV